MDPTADQRQEAKFLSPLHPRPSLLPLKFNDPNVQKVSKQAGLLTGQSFAFSGVGERGQVGGFQLGPLLEMEKMVNI